MSEARGYKEFMIGSWRADVKMRPDAWMSGEIHQSKQFNGNDSWGQHWNYKQFLFRLENLKTIPTYKVYITNKTNIINIY